MYETKSQHPGAELAKGPPVIQSQTHESVDDASDVDSWASIVQIHTLYCRKLFLANAIVNVSF